MSLLDVPTYSKAQVDAKITTGLADAVATQIVTPQTPTAPSLIGWVNSKDAQGTTDHKRDLTGKWMIASQATGNQVVLWDMTNPLKPIVRQKLTHASLLGPGRIARVPVAPSAGATDFVVHIANDSSHGGLMVLRLDPSLATPLSVVGYFTNDANYADAVKVNRMVVSADGNTVFSTNGAGWKLNAANITNRAAPARLSTYTDTVTSGTYLKNAKGVHLITPTRLAVAGGSSNCVAIFDVSSPSTLNSLIGPLSSLIDATALNGASSITGSGRYLTVYSDANGYLASLDVADALSPALSGSSLLASYNAASHIPNGSYAARVFDTWFLSGAGILCPVDVSDPRSFPMSTSVDTAKKLQSQSEIIGLGAGPIEAYGSYLVHISPDLGRINVFGAPGLNLAPRKVEVGLGHSMENMQGGGTTSSTFMNQSTRGLSTYANQLDPTWLYQHCGGVSSQTSRQIAARANFNSLPGGAVLRVWMNTNDMGAGISAAESLDNTKRVIAAAIARGFKAVIVCNIAARLASTQAIRDTMNAINAGLPGVVAQFPQAYLCDLYSVTYDPAQTGINLGDPLPNITYDGLHMTAYGAWVCGKEYKRVRDIAISGLALSAARQIGPNLIANPGLTGTGGTVGSGASGSFADSCAGTGFAGSAAAGNQGLALGASAIGDFSQAAAVTAGDWIEGRALIDATALVNVKRLYLLLTAGANVGYDLNPRWAGQAGVMEDGTTSTTAHSSGVGTVVTGSGIPVLGAGVQLATYGVQVPAGVTSATLAVHAETLSGGSITLAVHSMGVHTRLVDA